MAEDRSLDDFAAADAADAESAGTGSDDARSGVPDPDDPEGDDTDPDDPEGDDTDPDDPEGDDTDPADLGAVDPAVATSAWHADGVECDRCGERVDRRWRDGDALVCVDCASW